MGLDMYINDKHDNEIIYWRKANYINKWFESHLKCNGYIENLSRYPINKRILSSLKTDCRKVLTNHELAPILIPTQHGPFFGSYEYDESYFNQLLYTIDNIDKIFNTYSANTIRTFTYTIWY